MTRQFKTTTDLDRWYRVETLNLITLLETRRITENNYIYRMIQLGKKWDRYHNKLYEE